MTRTPPAPKKRQIDRFGERLATRSSQLSPGLRAVATYINDNRRAVLGKSALEIAAATGTSDATVIRAIQALGFEGLRDLKATLSSFLGTALSSVEKMASTTQALSSDINDTLDYVLEQHMRAAEVLAEPANRAAFADASHLLLDAGSIGIFGIGASGVLADYAARLFSRNGYPAYPLNKTGISLGEQLLAMREGDVLIMMGQANAHREGATAIDEAKRLGIPVILLTGTREAAFEKDADIVIFIPRGPAEKVPLHGPILMCLEVIMLGLSAMTPDKSEASLGRLHGFYTSIRKKQRSR